jgi:hypothetical protein
VIPILAGQMGRRGLMEQRAQMGRRGTSVRRSRPKCLCREFSPPLGTIEPDNGRHASPMLGPAQSASVCQARREFVANAFAVAFSRSAQAEIAIEQAAEALPGLASGARLNAPWSGARTSAKSSS